MRREIFVSTTFNEKHETKLVDTVAELADLGFSGIEIGSTHKERQLSRSEVEYLRRFRIVTHNFFPSHSDQNFVINIASMRSEQLRESICHVKKCIGVAADLGAEVYTVHPGFVSTVSPSNGYKLNYDFDVCDSWVARQDAMDVMLRSLDVLGSYAHDLGVELAIESEGSVTKPGLCLMETPEDYAWLFEHISCPLKINFNLAHSYFASRHYGFSYEDFVKQLINSIVLVEVSHNDGSGDQHLPLVPDSLILELCHLMPDVPHILEFRRCNKKDLKESKLIMESCWDA